MVVEEWVLRRVLASEVNIETQKETTKVNKQQK
ncbi:MAG: hypothetical protein MRERV_42c015 [Mycoplasmataceae bacterium RV_VA103A]|nr:MAG: hypothetical protein MRERV_42c015 [Mycoplasmataceae bacterium RV_VA103A]